MWRWLHKDTASPFNRTLTTRNYMPAAQRPMGRHQPPSSYAASLISWTGWHLTMLSWTPRRLSSSGLVRRQSAVCRSLLVAWCLTCSSPWDTMSTMLCAAASFSLVSYVLFEDQWLMKHCTHSSKRTSQAELTAAILLCMMSVTASSDDCSQSCMLPHGWSPASDTGHITPTLRDTLHWLPILQHITLKLCWWCSTVLVAYVRSTLGPFIII